MSDETTVRFRYDQADAAGRCATDLAIAGFTDVRVEREYGAGYSFGTAPYVVRASRGPKETQ